MTNDPRADVVKKALTDPAFKAALLKDPNAAVEKATGVKIPRGTSIKIVEDTASVVHLVLPAAAAGKPLSDADLGKVAGGFSITNMHCIDENSSQRAGAPC